MYIYLQRQRLQSFVKLRVEHFIFYMYFCSFFMSIPRRRLRQKIKKYQRNVKISSAMELCAPIERASLKSIRGKTFPLLYILILSRLVFREFIFFFIVWRAREKGTVWHATAWQQHYPNTRTRSYRQSTKKIYIYSNSRRLIYFVLLFDYFNLSRSYMKILRSFVKVTITINTS